MNFCSCFKEGGGRWVIKNQIAMLGSKKGPKWPKMAFKKLSGRGGGEGGQGGLIKDNKFYGFYLCTLLP